MTETSDKRQGSTPISSTRWDSSWPKSASEDERDFLFHYMEDRFGIPASEFKDDLLFTHQQSWWFLKKNPSTALPSRLKVRMAGLKAFQKVGVFIKPTTRLIQALGPRATKSRLDLSPEQLQNLLTQGAMDFPAPDLEDGYVILCLGEYVLGLGLLIRGRLKSQIPRKHLKYYGVDQ